ncbi:MAG: hypothetical protein ACTIL2_09595 [Corynebacterium sp.]|uniref:hypothetical protein n=1 Tax=Corynebacterium sp. TaxID=1720 RepID=UPI003F9D18FE
MSEDETTSPSLKELLLSDDARADLVISRKSHFNDKAAMFGRTAHLRKHIPAEEVADIVREDRDKGAEVDRDELP